MNIAILHYHLNRGGVTRVITNHLLALDSALSAGEGCRCAVVFGGRAAGWPHDLQERLKSIRLSLHTVDRLDYDSSGRLQSETLAKELRSVLRCLQFDPETTVLHAHNHSLGKNPSLPGALARLADEGFGLLLQLHDFAEDFRPDNYRMLRAVLGESVAAALYPQALRIHYAVLNRRDRLVLLGAGIEKDRLQFLPNPVPELGPLPDRGAARQQLFQQLGVSPDETFLLYPVRAIRRKNVGEALLWSLLVSGENCRLGITLAPLNPAEQTRYERWKRVAHDLRLPVLFETGEQGRLRFEENLSAADRIVTTSIAEGFGLVYLETWLADRMLLGRNLSEITADFSKAGIRLDGLYERLAVPVEYVGRDEFEQAFRESYSRVLTAYGRPALSPQKWDAVFERKVRSSCIDFGDLNEALQEHVLRRAASDAEVRDHRRRLNPGVAAFADADESVIRHNRRVVRRAYSVGAFGRRLLSVYHDLLAAPAGGPITALPAGDSILDAFLDPGRFRMLRDG